MNKETEAVRQVARAIGDFSDALIPLVNVFRKINLNIIEIHRIIYREQGSPFGDTEEGFSLWLEMIKKH